MERGTINVYDRRSGNGSLTDSTGKVLNFMKSDIKGMARTGMTIGDKVMFERVGGTGAGKAMNIMKG